MDEYSSPDGVPSPSKLSSFSDIVLEVKPVSLTDKKITPGLFGERLKQIRKARGSRRTSQPSYQSSMEDHTHMLTHTLSTPAVPLPTTALFNTSLPIVSENEATNTMTLPSEPAASKEPEPKSSEVTELFGIFTDTTPKPIDTLMEADLTPHINGSPEKVVTSSIEHTQQIFSPTTITIDDHIYEIPRPLELSELADVPPPPSSPPPTLPASPPPDLPNSEEDLSEDLTNEDHSLSPTILPGFVHFSGATTTSDEAALINAGHSDYTETPTDQGTPISQGHKERPRSRSVMSTTSFQDLHFKPSLKRWEVMNLNELDSIPPSTNSFPPINSTHDGKIRSNIDVRSRSSSNISWISSGNVERSLESIAETKGPNEPQDSPIPMPHVLQQRLTSNNLNEGDVKVTQVIKTSWQAKLIQDDELMASASTGDLPKKEISDDKTAGPEVISNEMTGTSSHQSFREMEAIKLKKRKKKKSRSHSMNEPTLHDHRDPGWFGNLNQHKQLYDMEDDSGDDSTEGNLHRLNQGIPKTISGLLEAVVSDIPALAESSSEESELETEKPVPITSQIPKSYTPAENVRQKVTESVKPTQDSTKLVPNTKQPAPQIKEHLGEELERGRSKHDVPRRGDLKRSEQQGMLKLHMHSVHPELMYKMFRVTGMTTASELISMSLKRANLIEDPHCFSINLLHNTTKATLHVLQDNDCPLVILNSKGTPDDISWELRKRTDHMKTINVIIEIPGLIVRSLSLSLSLSTTSHEAVKLIITKLGLSSDKRDNEKYRLLAVSLNEERMIGGSSPVLFNRAGNVQYKLVDLVHHLMKDQSKDGQVPNPQDLETARALIHQNHNRIISLERELVVKEYTLEQTTKDLHDIREELVDVQKTSHSQYNVYQEEQLLANKTIEELHGVVAQLISENQEKTGLISLLKTEKEKIQSEIKEKEKVLINCKATIDQLTISSEQSSLEREQELALLQEERNKLTTTLQEVQAENEQLQISLLNTSKTSDNIKSSETEVSRASLFPLLHDGLQHLLVSIEVAPTDQGLGIMLTNATTGGDHKGCVVKTVAETSSVHNMLLPGDRLLEINDRDVSSHTHRDIVGVLQEHLGPVQMVVCRAVPSGSNEVGGADSKDMTEIERTNVELNNKLKSQIKLTDHWRDKCNELTQQVNQTSSLDYQKSQLLEREKEVKEVTKEIQKLKEDTEFTDPINNIHNIRKQIVNSQPTTTEQLESIADTLKDASRDELLDALRTVEVDCLRHKETLDRLFALIIGHTPDLLSIMAEVQQPDKDSDIEIEGNEETDNVGWC